MKNNLPKWLLVILFVLPHPGKAQTTIVDIQRVDTAGNTDLSPLDGQEVTVTGVVTASAEPDNLLAIFIQQEGETEWAGIRITTGISDLTEVKVGDKIEVVGMVASAGGETILRNITEVTNLGTGTITPLELDPAIFTSYSLVENEKYEGMLVRFQNPAGLIHVVEVNADGNNNFGDWRIGREPATPGLGCRVLTGRITSSLISSLNVSYINSDVWETTSGRLNVPAIVVTTDTTFRSVTGVINYGFSNMRLLPRNNADFELPFTTAVPVRSDFLANALVSPNPVRKEATLSFELNRPVSLTIRLLDFNGRTVQFFFGESEMGVRVPSGTPEGNGEFARGRVFPPAGKPTGELFAAGGQTMSHTQDYWGAAAGCNRG